MEKVTLITGAARGIGRAVVEDLIAKGETKLVFVDKSYPPEFDLVYEWCEEKNIPYLTLEVDLVDPSVLSWIAAEVADKFGRMDAIVHNAGIHRYVKYTELTESDYDLTMQVNLRSAVFLTQNLLNLLTDDSRIVFISSYRAFAGSDHGLDYVVSKAGQLGAMRALAVELAPKTNVNAVAPFSIDTEMIEQDTEKNRDARIAQTLVKRIGRAKDVAAAVCYLLSEEAAYITGQTIQINGGAQLS